MNQQLMLLLQMQDIDKEVIALEKEKKKLPIRKQLSEVISEVTQLKEKYTKTEEFVTKAEAACDTLKTTYQQYDKKIAGLQKDYGELSAQESVESLEKLLADVTALRHMADKKTQEIAKIKQQLDKGAKLAYEIGKSINQKKETYDTLKAEYDATVAKLDESVQEKMQQLKQVEKQIDADLVKRYYAAKAKLNRPPIYELVGTTCRGCNMSLSNAFAKKASQQLLSECENCGCLLYTKEEN